MKLPYRPEIDGVRALAVLAIVAFHAEMPRAGGGFLGVDVFFVISGYLITRLLLGEAAVGSVDLRHFYERRVRRIMPALLLSLLVGLPVAWLTLVPHELANHAAAIAATLGFVSNLHYWKQRGYFDSAADLDPLIHTWSLGVEEQFYLFFPLVVVTILRRRPGALLVALLALTGISAALAIWGSANHPFAAFYLLPTRGWELMIGAIIATLEQRGLELPGERVKHVCAGAALAAMLLSFVLLDRHDPTPGLTTAIPVLATALLIASTRPGSTVHRLLTLRALAWIGTCSFSIYLLHQPALATLRLIGDRPPPTVVVALAMAGVFVAAWASWRWVESPCRDRTRVPLRRLLPTLGAGAALLCAFAAAAWTTRGVPSRFSPIEQQILAAADFDYRSAYRWRTCLVEAAQWRAADPSPECAPGPGSTVAVIGDSHAAALWSGLRRSGVAAGQYTLAACPPIVGDDVRGRPDCSAALARGLQRIAQERPAEVWVQFSWRQYAELDLARHLDAFLHELRRVHPHGRLVVVGNVPHWYPGLPRRAARDIGHWQHGARLVPAGLSTLRGLDRQLEATAGRHGAAFLAPLDALCDESRCLAMAAGDGDASVALTAWDDAHLTDVTAQWLVEAWTQPRQRAEATAR